MPTTQKHRGDGRPKGTGGRALIALAGGLLVAATTGASITAATDGPAPADRSQFDPGPSWAPDYGLMCEILERYGAADEHTCRTEPITVRRGPS